MEAVKPGVNFPELEKDILNFWSTNNTFKRSLEIRENCPKYTFYDGPPFATGTPHYGHLFQGTIKDIIPRYQTMKGFYVERRFGWDTHGLPIEMLIEQELGLKGRKEIIEYGVDKFNQKCRESVLKYAKEWERITTRLGRWIDFENDYKTMDLSFMESVWWVFKTLWDRGRIYKGLRVVPYSWRLSTPLSNFEVGLNYQTVQDPSITVALRLTKPQEEETYALIWTTTPWTLPSNIAVCVGPDITYSLIKIKEGKSKGAKFLLATERVPSYFSEGSFETVKTFKGTELAGWKYEPLFDYYRDLEKKGCFVFLVDDYVTVEEGTGIVHQSPAHGEDDFRVCTKAGLPVVDPVDDEGRFQEPVTDLKGKNIKEADKEIIKKIKEKGLLFKYETIEHSYPFCWRSDTPLIYKAISAWYVKVEDLREKLLKANSLIHWVPEHVKEGRFGKWLEQARDWNISRNRFWGNPLPVWECTECSNTECLGSRSELEEKCKEKVEDLHKHFVDKLSWSCAQCGKGTMKRVPEVLDCWFESGSMPYAYLHYPFENEDVFKESFPADFIGEAMDQTRGWFYTLLVLSVSLFNKPAYKNVITTGIVLAEDGKKMSKRLKNYPDPMYLMDKYGADALRLYMINSAVLKGETLRFSERGVKEIVRTVLLPYWNAYSFFTTYAVVDSYVPSLKVESGKLTPPQSSNMLDRWIISRLQTLLSLIEEEMGRYHLYQVVPKLISFLDELTNWYVRRSRRRFWSNNLEDKQQGYDTFFYVLLNFTKALAPFLPFVTEAIFKNLSTLLEGFEDSVHLSSYPLKDERLVDLVLEREMDAVITAVKLGRSIRAQQNIKIRQPLKSVTVVSRDPALQDVIKRYSEHITEELNVKEVNFSEKEEEFVDVEVKPNFAVLGPRLGARVKEAAKELRSLSWEKLLELEEGGSIEVCGEEITRDDIEVRRTPKGGRIVAVERGITVFFDLNISEDLRLEGIAREIVNRIQKMRKDADLEVTDRINCAVKVNKQGEESALIEQALEQFKDYIMGETLTLNLALNKDLVSSPLLEQEHTIEGVEVKIALQKS